MRYARIAGILSLIGQWATVRADTAADQALKDLEGVWRVVRIEAGGKTTAPEDTKEMSWTIKGNEITARDPDGMTQKMAFTLGAAKSPKEIDLTPADGPHKDKTILGIYELKDGQLKIRFRDPEAARGRPKEFSAEKRVGLAVITFVK